ncbi:MAG: processed acidic surface protein, partial [Bacillus sp. (in: Bacteria)]|nr:processed acidic surface protein [Bacillus sp. (in: firmicutes)]
MKRLLSVLLAIALSIGLIPFTAFAQINSQDQEYQTFLQEIGMSEGEFQTYIEEMYDYTLADFDSVSELKDSLGDLLDENNLQEILVDFEISKQELEDLLTENGTSLEDYVFFDDLYFEVMYLVYEEELTLINDESLKQLLEDYEFESKEELVTFLNNYDDSIENYEYIEDLELAVLGYIYLEAKDNLINVLDQFGLSLAEANNLANYALKLFEDPNVDPEVFFTKLEGISNNLMSFRNFDSADDLSATDIAEILGIWNDLLNLFDLNTEFYLTKDGKTTPISVEALMNMDSINGADLLIKIFSKDGKFLADMVITAEMFNSDYLEETGKNLEETEEAVKEVI